MKNLKFFSPTKLSFILIAMVLVTLSACKRDNLNGDKKTDNPGGEVTIPAKDLVVPANFNLETEKDLTVRVGVQNTSNPGERSVIKVYANVPSTGALIATGITDVKGEYTIGIRVPAMQEYIYIERIDQDGSSEYQKVPVKQFVTALFNGGQTTPFIFRKTGSGMNCTSGCPNALIIRGTAVVVSTGQTSCYTQTLGGIDITVRTGAVLKVCASGTIRNLKIEGTGKVYFLENTVIKCEKITLDNSSAQFYNYSDSLRVTVELKNNGVILNEGKIYNSKKTILESGSTMNNYGTYKIVGNASDNDLEVKGKYYNYHHTYVGDDLITSSGGGEVYNYCMLQVDDDFENDGKLYSNGYIKVGNNFGILDDAVTEFDNGAFTNVKNFTLDETVEGIGTNRSKIKVSNTSDLKSGSILKGKLDLCDSTGVESNNATYQTTAALSCSGYIASSTCFPESYGAPTIADADSDGVADSQDEYPNDATRAFNSYYPSATSCATLAYEDLWPSTGDFDYNDLVLAFNIHKVLNADNKVVDYKVKMKVRAIGAAFNNGFAFQLDELVPGDIQTITGQLLTKNIITRSANNTEANQNKAVVICYDSPEPSMQRTAGSMFNTIKANGIGTSDTIRINVSFASPVLDSKLAIGKFNPFIFTNQRRGYEVHLGNFAPTTLATTSLFGTFNDRSNPSNGTYYKNANGMPWAILLPVDFAYPVEYSPITSVYNTFDDWATSGGNTNTDWYTNNPGNRNSESIY